jgi:23S rRNA pseudouridine2605 synthase
MSIRLDRFIILKTQLSRRKLMDLLLQKKIMVNGNPAKDFTLLLDLKKDRVVVNGLKLDQEVPRLVYYKFNKPLNVITTLQDPNNRKTIADFIGHIREHIYPIGRLDRDTTGLLLLTNDGDFANKIAHPKFHVPKKYKVHLDHKIAKTHIARLLKGVMLEDGPFAFSDIEWLEPHIVQVTLSEGRNRIVRRAFDQLGYTVVKLIRLSVGPVNLGTLPEGKLKPISPNEMKALVAQLKEK